MRSLAPEADNFHEMRRGWLTRRRVVLLVLLVGALVEASVALAVLATGSDKPTTPLAMVSHPVAGNFKPDDTKLSACSSQSCYEQAFGNIAYYRGPKVALRLFAEKYGDYSDPGCHRVAHRIGSASLARNHGDVAKTFAEGSSACFSGYYHGILERALFNVKSFSPRSLARVARRLCADPEVRKSRWLTGACTHGLGHGLMITTGYDLPLALKVCDRLSTHRDNRSCNGGVFMENVSNFYGVQSRWLRDDDPLYPCDAVATSDKFECYELVTSHIVRANGGDWKKTAETCAGVENGWRSTCFWSFGRDVAGQAHYDPAGIKTLCALAQPYQRDGVCLIGSAMTMVSNFKSGKQASAFCDTTGVGFRRACYYAVGSVMAAFGPTAKIRDRNCQAITTVARYAAECVRGGSDNVRLNGNQLLLVNRRFDQLVASKGEVRALAAAIGDDH